MLWACEPTGSTARSLGRRTFWPSAGQSSSSATSSSAARPSTRSPTAPQACLAVCSRSGCGTWSAPGSIEIRPKPDGPGSIYEPTQAGVELSDVMLALQRLGLEVGGADARTRPSGRGAVGVGDLLPGPRPPSPAPGAGPLRIPHAVGTGQPWLAADRTRATPRSARNTRVARKNWSSWSTIPWRSPAGTSERLEWGDALRSGAIDVTGSSTLARALPTWNRRIQPGLHELPAPAAAP